MALYQIKYAGKNVARAYREWVALGHDRKHRLVTKVLDKYFYAKVRSWELDQ